MSQFNALAENIESNLNKVTEITDESTDDEYPSALAVKKTLDIVNERLATLEDNSIVESGTSGIWTYRKWSDGTAECWGNQKYTVTLRAGLAAAVAQINAEYPFAFIDTPTTNVSIIEETDWAHWIGQIITTTTMLEKIDFYANASGETEAGGTACITVKGRWK